MNPKPYSPLRNPVDLTNCDAEPVAFIGSVQPHGALLVVDPDTLKVVQYSANAPVFFDIEASKILGGSVNDLTSWNLNDEILLLPPRDTDRTYKKNRELNLELSLHRRSDLVFLEFQRTEKSSTSLFSDLHSLVPKLSNLDSPEEFTQMLADQLRQSLRVERVMVYRFLPDWTGLIVAESCESRLEKRFLNLRFPASDIPQPARTALLENWTRHIRAVSASPVELIPLTLDSCPSGTDLGKCLLRATSPIHIEYLQNMKVEGSLTCPLRVQNRLWGLVACHHNQEYDLSQEDRSALEIFMELASVRLGDTLSRIADRERGYLMKSLNSLGEELLQSPTFRLDRHLDELKSIVECDAVALFQDGQWWTSDGSLSQAHLDELRQVVSSLRSSSDDIRYTTELDWSKEEAYPGVLSPLLELGEEIELFWLRSPDSYAVEWAGDPRKESWNTTGTGRLHPRLSFEAYVENVEGKSESWSESDVWRAKTCRQVFHSIQLKLASKQRMLAEILQVSNRELQAFAYMASHDLREPIRGIHNGVEILKEDYSDVLGEEGNEVVDLVFSLTRRMDALLVALLEYARVDSKELRMTAVNVEQAVDDSICMFGERAARVRVKRPLPSVYAYSAFLDEIVNNLLSNALKYSAPEDGPIEVGHLSEGDQDGYVTLYVKDRGIGVAPEFHETIFDLFRRLHDPEEYSGGSGVGLTIVRKMVERHGGKIWLESKKGDGCTFYFTLPAV